MQHFGSLPSPSLSSGGEFPMVQYPVVPPNPGMRLYTSPSPMGAPMLVSEVPQSIPPVCPSYGYEYEYPPLHIHGAPHHLQSAGSSHRGVPISLSPLHPSMTHRSASLMASSIASPVVSSMNGANKNTPPVPSTSNVNCSSNFLVKTAKGTNSADRVSDTSPDWECAAQAATSMRSTPSPSTTPFLASPREAQSRSSVSGGSLRESAPGPFKMGPYLCSSQNHLASRKLEQEELDSDTGEREAPQSTVEPEMKIEESKPVETVSDTCSVSLAPPRDSTTASQSATSGHSDNLGPPLKKWATTSPSASTVEQYNTSDPSGRREKDQSACSQTSWCLNPEVEEFVPRQSAVPVEKPGPSVGRHAETAEPKSEEQALEPILASQQRQEELKSSSLTKLSEKAPFLFKLPQRPVLSLHRPGGNLTKTSTVSKATRDVETQTENERSCPNCRLLRLGGGREVPTLSIVKNVSQEHKIKYVACQAGMMVRENPECLDQESELKARLKAKLQAMCVQFGSCVSAKSELEDVTICRIAVDLLKEQPDFSHQDKLESFLRHLSVEAGVQVEIAHELMKESPVGDHGSSSGRSSLADHEKETEKSQPDHTDKTPVIPSTTMQSEAFSSSQPVSDLLSQNDAVSVDVEHGKSGPATENGTNFEEGVPAFSAATLNVPGVDLQLSQERAQLLKLQQSYLQSLLSLNLVRKTGTMLQENLTSETNQNIDQLLESYQQFLVPGVKHSEHSTEGNHSSLTVANLVRHNSLISQKDKARIHRTSESDGSISARSADASHHQGTDVSRSAGPNVKKVRKLDSLRKLPPIDLRAIKRAPKVLSQPLHHTEGRVSVDSGVVTVSDSSSSTPLHMMSLQPTLSKPHGTETAHPTTRIPDSETAPIVPSSVSASCSVRQPNTSTISTISKPRKYLTPLQRKRLKLKGETAVSTQREVQEVESLNLQENLASTQAASITLVETANPKSALSTSSSSFAENKEDTVRSNAPLSRNVMNLTSDFLTEPFSQLQHGTHPGNSGNISLQLASFPRISRCGLPSSSIFASHITQCQSEENLTAVLGHSGQPTTAVGVSGQPVIINSHSGQPAVTNGHSEPAVTSGHSGQPVVTSDHSEEPVVTSDHSGQPVVTSDHSGQPAVTSDHSEEPVVTSDHSGQPVTSLMQTDRSAAAFYDIANLPSTFDSMSLSSVSLPTLKSSLGQSSKTVISKVPLCSSALPVSSTSDLQYKLSPSAILIGPGQGVRRPESPFDTAMSEVSMSGSKRMIRVPQNVGQEILSSSVPGNLSKTGVSTDSDSVIGKGSSDFRGDLSRSAYSMKSGENIDDEVVSQDLDDFENIDDSDKFGDSFGFNADPANFDEDVNDIEDLEAVSPIHSTQEPEGKSYKEFDVPCVNLAGQFVSNADIDPEASTGELVDVDLLVKEKMEKSLSAAFTGSYNGLDEISLTCAHKKRTVPDCGSKTTEKAKPVKLDEGWQTVGKPKKKSKVPVDPDIIKFRTQEKYTNLVNLVLHVYKQLERGEAREILETVFTSSNQLTGLRQAQILAKVDLVVSEWYPDRAEKAVETEVPVESDNINGGSSVPRSQERRRSLSQGYVGLSTDRMLRDQREGGDGAERTGQQQPGSLEDDCQLQ